MILLAVKRDARRTLASAGLIFAMAVGSLLMWLANPVFWLWLASRMTSSTQPSMGPYLLVLAGVIATMVAFGKGLGWLNRVHARVTRSDGRVRVQAPWLRSMRGEREPARDASVLDVVMVATVGVAVVAMAVWFLLFAGSSLPGS